MKFGFIGAGKVGFSIGKYFSRNNLDVVGYYSKSQESAIKAAEFTNSSYFNSIEELINKSDVIFITTPDRIIKEVWDNINKDIIKNKIICHCSGSLSSEIFSNIEDHKAYGYSIHPLFAISDKYNSHKTLNEAFITIEGHERYLEFFQELFLKLGNKVKIISKENKDKYHAAATIVSNQVIALAKVGIDLLYSFGFSKEEAQEALYPLMLNNVQNIGKKGIINSLTGPVERGDVDTIKRHLNCLDKREDKELYKLLSKKLIEIAKEKNNMDYSNIEKVIGENDI